MIGTSRRSCTSPPTPTPRSPRTTQIDLDDPVLTDMLGQARRDQLIEDIALLDGASCDFDLNRVRHGKLSPVFFGSALTTFGVEPFLEDFLRMTTSPLPRHSSEGEIRRHGGLLLRLRLQNSGQHEQGPPGPNRLSAGLLRPV